MDRDHLYVESVVLFVAFEADSFLYLSLPKMILALVETGELLRGPLLSFLVPLAVL